jgi:hypothetical protein
MQALLTEYRKDFADRDYERIADLANGSAS